MCYKSTTVMFSRLKGLNKLFVTSFIPGFIEGKDHVDLTSKTAQKMAEENKNKVETGMDRLYMMFSVDEFGEPSPELVNIGQIMMTSMLVGVGIGGFVRTKTAFLDFTERNDATSFGSHYEAKRLLQDKITIAFAKGAWMWASRLSIFTGCYTLVSTAISVYRGENGIREHVIGGLVTGALYKVNLGVRGIVVGGCLGSVLGLFSGLSIMGILKLTGMTLDDVRKIGYWVKKDREGQFQGAIDEYLRRKEPPIVNKYEDRVGNKAPTLDSITTTSPAPVK